MEKLLTLIFLSLFTISISAQDSLCVFKVNGSIILKSNNEIASLKKGDFITKNDDVSIKGNSSFTAISSEGVTYKLAKNGEYNFNSVLDYPYEVNSGSVSRKYFQLVWKEFMNKKEGKTIIGGVFRGDQLMLFPLDNSKIASSKIKFIWKIDDSHKSYFLFIRNTETDVISKYELSTDNITLYKNNPMFNNNNLFEWVVTTNEFPNLDNIPFNTLELISKQEYRILFNKFKSLKMDLKALGLTSSEIESSICETYGICN